MKKEYTKLDQSILKLTTLCQSLEKENSSLEKPLKEVTSRMNVINAKMRGRHNEKKKLINVKSRITNARDRIEHQVNINERLKQEFDKLNENKKEIEIN